MIPDLFKNCRTLITDNQRKIRIERFAFDDRKRFILYLPFIPNVGYEHLCDKVDGWQYGEQGIINYIAKKIGVTNCAEIGAGDGLNLPVTFDSLIREGAKVTLWEIDEEKQKSLKRLYPYATVKGAFDESTSLDDFDFVSIDVDGNEYAIMESVLSKIQPKFIMVEHFDMLYKNCPKGSFVPPSELLGADIGNGYLMQSTTKALQDLAESKGYEIIGVSRVNSMFIRNDLKGMIL